MGHGIERGIWRVLQRAWYTECGVWRVIKNMIHGIWHMESDTETIVQVCGWCMESISMENGT